MPKLRNLREKHINVDRRDKSTFDLYCAMVHYSTPCAPTYISTIHKPNILSFLNVRARRLCLRLSLADRNFACIGVRERSGKN